MYVTLADDITCEIVSSSDSEVVCTLGESPAQQADIAVTVQDLGRTDTLSFTFTLTADSISPDTGMYTWHRV